MTKAKKAPSKKKKLTLDKETVRKLTDKELGGVAGGLKVEPNSYTTCNMKCRSDPKPACG